MSGAALQAPSGGALVARAWRAGLVVGVASLVIFLSAEQLLLSARWSMPALRAFWNHPDNQSLLAARWAQVMLVRCLRAVPGSNPATVTIVTILAATVAQGLLARDLILRGWEPLLAALGVLLSSLNPVVLFVATSGAPFVLVMVGIGFVILAVDRVEAIEDTRSLIMLGLSVALLFLLWPDAIYWVMPMLVLLPLAFRKTQGMPAASALFAIVLMPAFILVVSLMLGGSLFELPPVEMVRVWTATLHGVTPGIVARSAWLGRFGGEGLRAFATLVLLTVLVTPCCLLVPERLVFRPAERQRPVTAVAALVLPPLAGALATAFWHVNSPIPTIGYSIAAVAAWTATSNFRRAERVGWVLLTGIGTLIGWIFPILWQDAGMEHWRRIILGA